MTRREIENAIRRFERRVEEVKHLAGSGARHDSVARRSAEENVHAAILETFGNDSPEYLNYYDYRIRFERPGGIRSDPQTEFEQGIPRAVEMLENFVARLREMLAEIQQDPEEQAQALFAGLTLHPRIAAVCTDLFRDGHYRNAVLDACVALVNFVKERSRCHGRDGAPLMRTVFSRHNPILAFNELRTDSDENEQEGMMHLYEGAVLALRTPRAHTLLSDSADEAVEYISLISMLARRLEKTRRHREPTPDEAGTT